MHLSLNTFPHCALAANHAEINAITNRSESTSLDNCTIFVTTFPCIECAKMIAQAGIKHIVYTDDSSCQKQSDVELNATKLLLQASGVSFTMLD